MAVIVLARMKESEKYSTVTLEELSFWAVQQMQGMLEEIHPSSDLSEKLNHIAANHSPRSATAQRHKRGYHCNRNCNKTL